MFILVLVIEGNGSNLFFMDLICKCPNVSIFEHWIFSSLRLLSVLAVSFYSKVMSSQFCYSK